MKILSVSPAHLKGYKIGGPIVTIESMYKGLTSKNISVDVLSTTYGLENEKEETLYEWQAFEGINNYRVKYYGYWGYGNFTFSPKLILETFKIIKTYDLLIIHGIWNFPCFFSALASLIKKTPYVFVPHGTLYKETIELKSKVYKKILFHLIIKQLLKRSTSIHFTTQDEKEKVLSYLKMSPKCFVIPNSIDVAKYINLPPKGSFLKDYPHLKNKRLIVFYGRITQKKGLDILIEAFSKLSKEFTDIHLVIAGGDDENYSEKVNKWILKYNLSERITFTGMLSGENKYSVLIDSEIFILSSYSENFGMSVIEAMLCGIPVVISRGVGIYHEVENNDAGIVTDITAEATYNGIKELMQNEEKCKKYINRAKLFVKEYYDIEMVTEQLIKQYKTILYVK